MKGTMLRSVLVVMALVVLVASVSGALIPHEVSVNNQVGLRNKRSKEAALVPSSPPVSEQRANKQTRSAETDDDTDSDTDEYTDDDTDDND
ncbi:hypothetical protein Hamer_G004450 [Homarus americanus]|uniref:Uncharacterized protein n=1 Tax=Homarus americanus TaxID=6706 RepID=A0A8J5MT71_HOMAM|nr:hypothetical protein Hamer_G004450 [Homarus americanus]